MVPNLCRAYDYPYYIYFELNSSSRTVRWYLCSIHPSCRMLIGHDLFCDCNYLASTVVEGLCGSDSALACALGGRQCWIFSLFPKQRLGEGILTSFV